MVIYLGPETEMKCATIHNICLMIFSPNPCLGSTHLYQSLHSILCPVLRDQPNDSVKNNNNANHNSIRQMLDCHGDHYSCQKYIYWLVGNLVEKYMPDTGSPPAFYGIGTIELLPYLCFVSRKMFSPCL